MSPLVVKKSELETRLFINNEFVNSVSGKTFPTVDPSTEEVIAHVQEADQADVDKAVKAATAAFELGSPWRSMAASDRGKLIWKLADLIEQHADYLQELESMDNGKPLGRNGQYGTKVDVELTVAIYRYAAGWADKIEGSVIPVDGNTLCYTRKEPIGVCGSIIPWNFPLAMQSWKLAPALAAGCTMVMKTSEKTPLTALFVSKLVKEAGFPAGVVNTLSGYGPTCGQAIAKHPGIDKVAFTGSTSTANEILSAAGLKRTTMELGGKSPVIVCDDADLDVAAEQCHVGLFLNQGQCCCAGSRIYVQDTIYDKFVAKAIEKAKEMKTGGFQDLNADHGPQVDDIQFKRVMGYIEKGKKEGAKCVLGGNRHGEKGYFVEPTIFTDVGDKMTIAQEEIFGPVMSVMKFSTDEEVIVRANATMYGLGAGIMSQNISRALGLANQIRSGSVWINTYDDFSVQAPFGGYKASGHGREKGKEMLDNYLETKCVFVPLDGPKC
jgi:aldehyde dehydrogenase (NAD+)